MTTRPHRPGRAGIWPLALIAAVSIVQPSKLTAQSLTGALIGAVKDTHGAGVPDAVVRIRSTALIGGSLEVRTNDKGSCAFPFCLQARARSKSRSPASGRRSYPPSRSAAAIRSNDPPAIGCGSLPAISTSAITTASRARIPRSHAATNRTKSSES